MDQTLERLHHALAQAIRSAHGENFGRPVTIAEIYQELVPYRAVRARLGFEINADYEHTLLRLLAGEGNCARVEPAEVRELLRGELTSANPNVALFRDYADCDVFIATAPGQFVEPEPPPVPSAPPLPQQAEAPAAVRAGSGCASCGATLPAGRTVHYCPFCGRKLTHSACANCGSTLERSWHFCGHCGTPVAQRT